MLDLYQIKKDFSNLVLQTPQWTLTQFVIWLDLKVAEYKVNGYMVLDDKSETMPRWIDQDILDIKGTAPWHRSRHPCSHRHEKRRRKWRRWCDGDMGMGLGKRCHRREDIMSVGAGTGVGGNQDNTLVEISDESSYSDIEYISDQNELDLSAASTNEPHKQNVPHPLFLTQVTTDISNKPKLINTSKRCSTDSVVENVDQISISIDHLRPNQSSVNTHPFLCGDNTSKDTGSVGAPEMWHEEVNKTLRDLTSTSILSASSSPAHNREGCKKSQEVEAMVTQDPDEVIDIKPDIDLLQKQTEAQDVKDENKFELGADLVPLSPVTSALISYKDEKQKSPDSSELFRIRRHPDEVPDLFDDNIKRYLHAGQRKLVWNKAVGACASYLVHACKGQPTSSDYQWLCKAMYARYPSLGSHKGPNPWSCFNRAVSQKIRHTRFKIRQMGKMSAGSSNPDELNLKQMAQNTCLYS